MTDEEQPPIRPSERLRGITEDDYQLWRHHPVTKLLLQYMGDFRDVLIREALARWEAGTISLAQDQEMRAKVLTLRELGGLPWYAIESFYQEESKTNDAA